MVRPQKDTGTLAVQGPLSRHLSAALSGSVKNWKWQEGPAWSEHQLWAETREANERASEKIDCYWWLPAWPGALLWAGAQPASERTLHLWIEEVNELALNWSMFKKIESKGRKVNTKVRLKNIQAPCCVRRGMKNNRQFRQTLNSIRMSTWQSIYLLNQHTLSSMVIKTSL